MPVRQREDGLGLGEVFEVEARLAHSPPVSRVRLLLDHLSDPSLASSPSSVPTSISSRRVVTRSACWARSESASLRRATPMAYIPPALAAAMPAGASSTTKQRLGATPCASAATGKRAGSGLPRGTSPPFTFAANRSSRLVGARTYADPSPRVLV